VTSTSPEVCLKRSTLTPRQPLPSLEETVSTAPAREPAEGARVAVDDFSQVAPVDRRHPVTVSFVGEHTLHILRSEWASEKRIAYPTVLKRALSEEPD